MKRFVKKTVVCVLVLSLFACLGTGIGTPLAVKATEVREPEAVTFPAPRLSESDVLEFEKQHPLERTMAGALLVDLTSGEAVASKNSTMLVSPSELTEWLLILYALRNEELKAEVTLTKGMLNSAAKAQNPILVGLKEGETLSLEELIKLFLMTQSDDARVAIATHLAGSERQTISMLNRLAKVLRLSGTEVVTSDGAYASGQHTCAYDLYVVLRELLTFELFSENYAKSSLTVRITQQDGSERSLRVKNSGQSYSHLYGTPTVPQGITFLARMSGGGAVSGLAQIMLVRGADAHVYMGILTGIPFEKDISIESERLLRVLNGETYYDKEQSLPLGDDTVRYRYLLGTDVKYYTVDQKAPGYANNREASRYMMEITVPVWHLEESTGARTASTMPLVVNRKLVNSVRTIFREIFALPCQFPIKTLLGYGYRQSGGVGLSNCTLMSIHSYGAAIDINPGDYDNDYYLGAGNDLRDRNNPYCIPDEVIEIFERNGWFWGGNFSICVDSMHFQYLGLDFLTYQDNSPFVTVDLSKELEVGAHIENLQLRLTELGYRVNKNGIFSEQTRRAVMKFQKREGLPVTGVVDYKTWETMINLTHYMEYAF